MLAYPRNECYGDFVTAAAPPMVSELGVIERGGQARRPPDTAQPPALGPPAARKSVVPHSPATSRHEAR